MLTIALAEDAVVDRDKRTLSCAYHSVTLPDALFACIDTGQASAADLDDDTLSQLAELGLACVRLDGAYGHWSELIMRLVCTVRECTNDVQTSIFDKIANGSATKEQIESWVVSMFMFTKSAAFHTGEMLHWAIRRQENTQFWRALCEEESGHWKIYRRIFTELGLDHDAERDRALSGSVWDLLELLRAAARSSETHYAALLYPIEQGPDTALLDEDPCFGALVRHYGFSRDAVLPLFLHTKLNADIGHSRIWIDVIRRNATYRKRTIDDILGMSRCQMDILATWGRQIEQGLYR
jgi:hypothetical protein